MRSSVEPSARPPAELQLSADGRWVMLAPRHGPLELVGIVGGAFAERFVLPLPEERQGAAFCLSAGAPRIVTVSKQGRVGLWDPVPPAVRPARHVAAIAVASTTAGIIVSTRGSGLRLLHAATSREVDRAHVRGETPVAFRVCGDQRTVVGHSDLSRGRAELLVLNWEAGRRPGMRSLRLPLGVSGLGVRRDCQQVALGLRSGRVQLMSLATAAIVLDRQVAGSETAVVDVDYSADGRRIVAAAGRAIVLLGADLTPSGGAYLEHRRPVTAVIAHPDGHRVISADEGGQVLVWDRRDGRAIRTMKGHLSARTKQVLDPTGRYLLVADMIHDLSDRRSIPLLAPLDERGELVHTLPLDAALFTADGRQVVGISRNVGLRLFSPWVEEQIDLARAAARPLSVEERRRFDLEP